MDILDMISSILPNALSIIAVIVASLKGKKPLSSTEIEERAEKKKQKYIAKLNRKNKIQPTETSIEVNTATSSQNSENKGGMISGY